MKSQNLKIETFELLLRPIARLCLRRSLKFQDFLQAAKNAFVHAATQELSNSNIEPSCSRLSVMTGLQRPDIDKILSKPNDNESPRSLTTRILGLWSSSKEYRDKAGRIRSLSFEGRESEFFKLVAEISRELNAYAVLFDLERLGHVKKTKNGLKLLSTILVTSDDVKSGIEMLSRDTAELFAAVEENLFDQQTPPNLHLHAQYDNVCIEYLPKIRQWCLEEGSKFITKVQEYISMYDKDLNPKLAEKQGGGKITVGTFSNTSKID